MIIDKLENAELYRNLHAGIARGLELLESIDVAAALHGKHEVDGDRLFYICDQYVTKNFNDGSLERHRKYIDIQYIVSGRECIGHCLSDQLEVEQTYDDEKDIEFFKRCPTMTKTVLHEGEFAIFWPSDAHMPGRLVEGLEEVKKVVVKVLA